MGKLTAPVVKEVAKGIRDSKRGPQKRGGVHYAGKTNAAAGKEIKWGCEMRIIASRIKVFRGGGGSKNGLPPENLA